MKNIKLDHVTKIEGHAKLHVIIDKGKVKKADLQVFEGSRFFEGILKGKRYDDLSPISSRICGVCSVVHAITALESVEKAMGVKVSKQTRKLRQVMNIAGTLQSHTLHLYFMVLPDYFGFSNALKLAAENKELIVRALDLKRFGNRIVRAIGARDVHPFTFVVGGISRSPEQEELDSILQECKKLIPAGKKTMELFAKIKVPDFELKRNYYALTGGNYFCGGDKITCYSNEEISTQKYENHVSEYFQEGSTSEFVMDKKGNSYMVGAMARILIKGNLLSEESRKYQKIIEKNKFNPFYNNLAQAIEIFECLKQIEKILTNFKVKKELPIKFKEKAGNGIGAFEAPRGILFHRYTIDKNGFCTSANITTPTSQSLQNLQENIRNFLPKIVNQSEEKIKLMVEELIRAYDPCISCSTHFLELKLERK